MGGEFPATFPFCFAEYSCDTLIPHSKDASILPYCALILTRTGDPTYTYYLTDRIKQFDIHQDPFKDNATFVLANHDKHFTSLSLEGYKATIRIGLTINGTTFYATLAPQWVITQSMDSEPGVLNCYLEMIGIVSSLQDDKASKEYKGSGSSKSLIDDILNAVLSSYTHCQDWNVVWHGDAGVHSINLYAPSAAFRIDINTSRLNAVRQLLNYDISFMRPESDEKIHLRRPVTSGTDYDWEFMLGEHVFFTKRASTNLLLPNYVSCTCKTSVDGVETAYQGIAQDSESIDAYREIRQFVNVSGLTSNDQAEAIAQGVLNNIRQTNFLAEVRIPPCYYMQILDYIQVIDAREGTEKVGNVGYIDWHFSPGKFYQNVGFGGWQNIRKVIANFWRNYEPDEMRTTFPFWITASCPGTRLTPNQYLCFGTVLVPRGRTLFIGSYSINSNGNGGRLRIVEWDEDSGYWVDIPAISSPIGADAYYNGQAIDVYDSYDTGGTPVAFVVENDTEETIEEVTASVAYDTQFLPGGLP